MAIQNAHTASTHSSSARPRPVHELIRERAKQRPGALAIVDGTRRMTFAELDAASDALAARLAARGAGPEVPVGVSVKRSAELFVARASRLYRGRRGHRAMARRPWHHGVRRLRPRARDGFRRLRRL
jgi:non-ribosomal peptide synthetase component F